MTAKNDITGHSIVSRANSKSFQDNFDAIFKKRSQDIDTPDKQRKVLVTGNGSMGGVPGACSDYGNTDLADDGNIK